MLEGNLKKFWPTIAPKSTSKLTKLTYDSGNEVACDKTATILNEYLFFSLYTQNAITQPQVLTEFHRVFYSLPKILFW